MSLAVLAGLVLASSSPVLSAEEPALFDLGGLLLSAFSGGNYALLGAAALLLAVLLARKAGGRFLPFLATARGGALLSLAVTVLTPLVARLSAGAPLSLGLVLEALSLGLSASGLWSVGKNLATRSGTAQVASQSQGLATECTPMQIANGTCKP